jgi:putative addiction module component (TIGR02574 family)
MDYAAVLNAARALPWDDQLRLLNELTENLGAGAPESGDLDDETKQMLDRRIADMEANPNDVVPWEQVYADAKSRLRK